MRILWSVVKWTAFLFLALIVLAFFGGSFLVEIPFTLAFGWIPFLRDNFAAMEINPLLLAEAAVCVGALATGGHWFARWLYREMVPNATVPWRPGWTVAGLGGVLLLFAAGIATIGITHQAAWLYTAKGPLLQDAFGDRTRVAQALVAAAEAQRAVAGTFEKTGKLPATNAEAGWVPRPAGRHATALAVGPGGVVSLEIAEAVAGGGIIALTPVPDGGTLNWKCRSTLPLRVLPSSCRDKITSN
jgi:hypothetical protein